MIGDSAGFLNVPKIKGASLSRSSVRSRGAGR